MESTDMWIGINHSYGHEIPSMQQRTDFSGLLTVTHREHFMTVTSEVFVYTLLPDASSPQPHGQTSSCVKTSNTLL